MGERIFHENDDPNKIQSSLDFTTYLWDVIQNDIGLSQIRNPEKFPVEIYHAGLVNKLLPSWKEINNRLWTNPKSLSFREASIEKMPEFFIDVLRIEPNLPPDSLPLKYSLVKGVVDLEKPNLKKFPVAIESGIPQYEFAFEEIFNDSKRELKNAIEAMETVKKEIAAKRLTSSMLPKLKFLETVISNAKDIRILNIKLVGKVSYYDRKLKDFRPINLMGTEVQFADFGKTIKVNQVLKYLSANYKLPFPGLTLGDSSSLYENFDLKIEQINKVVRKVITQKK